jgi:hypothetical protein
MKGSFGLFSFSFVIVATVLRLLLFKKPHRAKCLEQYTGNELTCWSTDCQYQCPQPSARGRRGFAPNLRSSA